MKFTLSYFFAVSLLVSLSVNGQKIQEPHQCIEKINTANGQVSIDTTIERHHLFRRRLHVLNRRADPVEEVRTSVPVSGKGTFSGTNAKIEGLIWGSCLDQE